MKKKKSTKTKDKPYKMKSTNGKYILRIVFWVILSFIFIRGIISCLHQDEIREMKKFANDFREEFYSMQATDYELLGFAETFCQEYLTYDKDKESFSSRLSPYFSKNVNIEAIYNFDCVCEAVSTHAYKIDETSDSQVDVYVKCQIIYAIQDSRVRKNLILKVPVYIGKNGYVIEDIPLYTNDTMYDSTYSPDSVYNGELVDSDQYEVTVKSFLAAYYNTDQNAVNYILSSDADVSKFNCLGNLYSFTKIESIEAYKEDGEILCLVSFKITDTTSGAVILQNINLTLLQSGKKIYVKDINTKISNLEEKND